MPNNQVTSMMVMMLGGILTVFVASAINPTIANANYQQQSQYPCNR